MESKELASIADKIAECASERPEIQAAYLFGSAATGRVRADSDLDVAVLLDPAIPPDKMFDHRLDLMADLGAALHRSDVEVVILNQAPPLLAHRVLSKGKLVFEGSASARVQFQVRTASRYLDLIPAYETHIRYLKRSVREGGIVG